MGVRTYPAWAAAFWASAAVLAAAPPSFSQAGPASPRPSTAPPGSTPSPSNLPPLPPSPAPPSGETGGVSGSTAPPDESGAPSPGSPQSAPPPPSPPPGYPPDYGAQSSPSSAPPAYAQQPRSFEAYAGPPLPPALKRNELQWSIRVNPLDLIYGRISTDVEYAFYGPLSAGLGFQYIFAEPGLDRQLGVKGDGYGVYGELGFWIEGRPLRGFFLKGRVGHSQVTVYGLRELAIPQTRIGALFGSQSIYGGWFTLTYGLGVSYDTQSKDRMLPLRVNPTTGREESVIIEASGIFGNGWDLITMVAIGGSF